MKSSMLNKMRESAATVKDKINEESYNMLIEGATDFEDMTLEIYTKEDTPMFSISFHKEELDEFSIKDSIKNIASAVQRFDRGVASNPAFSMAKISGVNFNRVDVFPSYGDISLKTTYLICLHGNQKLIILIMAQDEAYNKEISRFFDSLILKPI